jgi:hypothetical protein
LVSLGESRTARSFSHLVRVPHRSSLLKSLKLLLRKLRRRLKRLRLRKLLLPLVAVEDADAVL